MTQAMANTDDPPRAGARLSTAGRRGYFLVTVPDPLMSLWTVGSPL